MTNPRIADYFDIKHRFLRSTYLERDFADPSALQGYILTDHNRQNLLRMMEGLSEASKQRSWRITGDYGSGKSSFGLMLAHVFAGNTDALPAPLQQAMNFDSSKTPSLLPVLVTGSREPLSTALLRSLYEAIRETCDRGRPPLVLSHLQEQLETPSRPVESDKAALDLLGDATTYIKESGKKSGILIILDELGKFLEFAALHPERQDIYFLQKLAEIAARSNKAPLFVVGLLHQGFNAYADRLSQPAQKEWEKVAGRYEELLFNQPLEESVRLVAEALGIREEALPNELVKQAKSALGNAVALGWYGVTGSVPRLDEYTSKTYPLHPTVLPVLVRLFSRFGQNERSLFSFLFSNEPFGLREFAERSAVEGRFYRLHHLYDYARVTFGHKLGLQSYRSHWKYIESVIESFPLDDAMGVRILKTVGLLNLIDAHNLLASEEAVMLAVSDMGAVAKKQVKEKLQSLRKYKRILYFRGEAGGYCLWPHTSVNLDKCYEAASRAIGTPGRIAEVIRSYLETRPLVARRHYIESGNLRHFNVLYVTSADLTSREALPKGDSDGLILIPLCETEEERQEALRRAPLIGDSEVLVAVPGNLNSLVGLLQEVQRWEWISKNTPELTHDPYAAEEVSRQIAASTRILEQRIQSFVGLRNFTGTTELCWFHKRRTVDISNGKQLLAYLSVVCDAVYQGAPKISNELVNRRSLSSAAAAARMRLLERMFDHPLEPMLGMDPSKKPPEMSIYLSILKRGGLHQEIDGVFTFAEPAEDADISQLRPALGAIRAILMAQPDSRVCVTEIFERLRQPPFGVRDGVIPILLASFFLAHEQDIAMYEDDRFLRQVGGFDFHRLVKAPETFELQYCQMTSVRLELFGKLFEALGMQSPRKVDLLDIVRQLSVFAAQLSAYTQKTKKLGTEARAVQDALQNAREPATLLFYQLPEACGFSPFAVEGGSNETDLKHYVDVLKGAIAELRAAYPELQRRMKQALSASFDLSGSFSSVRVALAERAEGLLLAVRELKLKAFCLRLADRQLPDSEWVEALGSLLCGKPPAKWLDTDEDLYYQELEQVSGKLMRVESMNFRIHPKGRPNSAVRVALTQVSGLEMDRVVYIPEGAEQEVQRIEAQITQLLHLHGNIGLAGASQAIWKMLLEKEPPTE
jgi:hypothetical protein